MQNVAEMQRRYYTAHSARDRASINCSVRGPFIMMVDPLYSIAPRTDVIM